MGEMGNNGEECGKEGRMLKTVELTPKRMTSSGLPCTAPTKEMSALLSALVGKNVGTPLETVSSLRDDTLPEAPN